MGLRAHIKRLLSDDRGSLSMEFMIWVPLLVLWTLFSIGMFKAWDSRNDSAKMAYSLSDLLSRQTEVDAALLQQTLALTDRLAPGRGGLTSMRVSSIRYEGVDASGNDEFTVIWSCGFRGPTPLTDALVPVDLIPTMQPLDSILMTEFYTPYVPLNSLVDLSSYEWGNVLVTRPRLVREIGLDAGGCV